jgi:hypothetical protein
MNRPSPPLPLQGDTTTAGPAAPALAEAFGGVLRDPLVLALVKACGSTECHLIGGVLRDRALGLTTRDLDAVVAGRGREIAEALAERLAARLVLLGGKEFAAYRLVVPETAPQRPGTVATAGAPPPGAVVDLWDRETMSLEDDLARRDFTVNSFALEARGGSLTDPFGGLADLAARTLRATTHDSFAGDPLRVLRLVRLLLHLPGFHAEPATFELARQAAPGLSEVAAERIRDELWMVLSHPHAERGLRTLGALGLYPGLWLGVRGTLPADAAHAGIDATNAAVLDRAAAELAAVPDRATDLDRLLEASQTADWKPIDLVTARLAATFRHLPGGTTRKLRPTGPAATASRSRWRPPPNAPARADTPAAVVRMVTAGYISARQASEIAPLLAAPAELPATEIDRRRFLNRHGRRWLTVACSFGAAATAAGREALERWRQRAEPLCEVARREGAELIAPPRLLTGADVQHLLRIPAGPPVGSALAALTAAQVEGTVRTRADAERFLLERANLGG